MSSYVAKWGGERRGDAASPLACKKNEEKGIYYVFSASETDFCTGIDSKMI